MAAALARRAAADRRAGGARRKKSALQRRADPSRAASTCSAERGFLAPLHAAGGADVSGFAGALRPEAGSTVLPYREIAGSRPFGFAIDHRDLVEVLRKETLKRPNLELRSGERVTNLIREEERVVGVETTAGRLHAPLVLGCDGRHSKIAHAARSRGARHPALLHRRRALGRLPAAARRLRPHLPRRLGADPRLSHLAQGRAHLHRSPRRHGSRQGGGAGAARERVSAGGARGARAPRSRAPRSTARSRSPPTTPSAPTSAWCRARRWWATPAAARIRSPPPE